MFFAENLKKKVYVAKRSVTESGVNVYGEPVEYRVSCYLTLPTSASARLEESGTRYTGYMQIVGDPEYLKDIKRFDRVYVDTPVPNPYNPLADDADYYVYRKETTPTCTTLVLWMVGEGV